MRYFKHAETGEVFAYNQSDIDAVNRIPEMESSLLQAQTFFTNLPTPVEGSEESELEAYESARRAVSEAQSEIDAVLPVFFDIREKLKTLTEMTLEEIDAHLNPPTEPQYKTQFSVLEFRGRFTTDERITIRQAQFNDMEVGLVYDDFHAAQFIDVADPRVEQGIDLYIAKGLLDPKRKAKLLEPELVE